MRKTSIDVYRHTNEKMKKKTFIAILLITFFSCYKEEPPELEMLVLDTLQEPIENCRIVIFPRYGYEDKQKPINVDTTLYTDKKGMAFYSTQFECFVDVEFYLDSVTRIDTAYHLRVNQIIKDTLMFNK